MTVTEQFPSLDTTDEAGVANEVEQRSADGAEGQLYKKVYRAQVALEVAQDEDNPIHHDNRVAVLQEAIQRGLHPKEEATFLGAEVVHTNRSGRETCDLTYGVEVEPAVIDELNQETTVEPAEALDNLGGTTRPQDDGAARHAREG
jgi:hypothetical protein